MKWQGNSLRKTFYFKLLWESPSISSESRPGDQYMQIIMIAVLLDSLKRALGRYAE
jgi:hypothetical protein